MTDNKALVQDIYGEDFDDEIIKVEEAEDDGVLKVKTIEDAARYAYGLSETRKSIAELEAIAEKEIAKWQEKIDKVKAWLDEVTTPLKRKEEYLANQLKMFHITQYNSAKNEKEQKKLTTIKLPYGVKLQSRAQQPKFEIVNEQSYKEYAKENNLLKIKEEVDWATLKKNIIISNDGRALNKETGEFLDFIKVVPQERKFEVK